jgi:hypothetical protein
MRCPGLYGTLNDLLLEIDIPGIDLAYVEYGGGVALLSYLREGSARAEQRRNAVQRSFDTYNKAMLEEQPEAHWPWRC